MASSWADRAATRATCSRLSTATAWALMALLTAETAWSMPDFNAMGLAPAATFIKPLWMMERANTTEVVVPSPTMSLVLAAASFTTWAPMFS